MDKIKAAIIGFGNIGSAAYEAITAAGDFETAGIVVKSNIDLGLPSNIPVVTDISLLKGVDVAIIAAPSRAVPDLAESVLLKGISTVDSYDIHSSINDVRARLNNAAKKSGCAAITAAGWDPGTDSCIRALMLAMAPQGITYTDFGPGVSMGHTVCAKSKEGVKDALSLTFPKGQGIHRRIVYVQLKYGYDLDKVSADIKQDPYFTHDETHIIATDDIAALKDLGHGVTITRKGVSGKTHNQHFSYGMRINNPALTAQVLLSCARAVLRQQPGCYTMIEIPPVDYLAGNKEDLIAKLV